MKIKNIINKNYLTFLIFIFCKKSQKIMISSFPVKIFFLTALLLISSAYSQFSAQTKLNTSLLFPNITNFPGNFYSGYAQVTNNLKI